MVSALNSSLMRSVRTGPRSSEKKKPPREAPSRLVPRRRAQNARGHCQTKRGPSQQPSPVVFVDSTLASLGVRLDYAGDGLFCRADSYSLKKRGDVWTAKSRGGCLLTKITATIKRNGKDVRCDPYTSSGTSYSKFVIEASGPDPYLDLSLIHI